MGLSNTSNNNAAAAGEFGSVFTDTTTALVAPAGKYFFSITFLATSNKFESSGGLIATDSAKYMNTEAAASAGGSGGQQVDASNDFPAGLTIFGQWTTIDLNTGSVVAHLAS